MTTTIETLPPLADAMTQADVRAHLIALSEESRSIVSAVTNSARHDESLTIIIDVGSGWRDNKHIRGATWPETITAARAWLATHATVHRDNRIRAMALAIIDLTDQHGRCDRAMLTRREFSGAEIDDLKDAACKRASEMSANAPFVVEG
jgi:hypothetical protein